MKRKRCGGRAGSGRACGVRVGGGRVGGGRGGGGRGGGGRGGGGHGGGGRVGGGRAGGGRGSGGRGSYPQRWYWRCREAILKEEVHHGSWIISACWRVSSPLCPVALTERFWKEGRRAGHAHLLGKVVTRGKKGRSYIRGSITCAREQEAVCKAESPVRLKCASMACTVYLLVEFRSGRSTKPPHQAALWLVKWSSDDYIPEETLPSLTPVSRSLQPMWTCVWMYPSSPPMLCLLCTVGAWRAARSWCACCLGEPRARGPVMNS